MLNSWHGTWIITSAQKHVTIIFSFMSVLIAQKKKKKKSKCGIFGYAHFPICEMRIIINKSCCKDCIIEKKETSA